MRRMICLGISMAAFVLVIAEVGARPGPSGPGAPATHSTQRRDNATPRPTGSSLTQEERKIIMSRHNELRAEVGVPRLRWSPELAAFAQEWADRLSATSCAPEHRPTAGKFKQLNGENIYITSTGAEPLEAAVTGWGSEKRFYSGQPVSVSDLRAFHYTQIVWRATTQIGCAMAECNGNVIVVCNYSPAGNTIGQKAY